MKKHSSKKASKGKNKYRTPSRFIANKLHKRRLKKVYGSGNLKKGERKIKIYLS